MTTQKVALELLSKLDGERTLLIEKNYLSHSFRFSTDVLLKEVLAPGSESDPYPGDEYSYEPRLVHQHIGSVSQLLERAVAFRREARDLEILAFKVALDYRLFDSTSLLEEQLELSRLFAQARQRSAITHRKAADSFKKNDDNSSIGFFEAHDGRAAEIDLELDQLREQERLIRERYSANRKYQESYRQKHAEPGSAHNYAERQSRLLKLIVQDIRECQAKALAISEALRTIWKKDIPFPLFESPDLIDLMIDWNRDVVRFLESVTQNETVFDLVIPLCQPWLAGEKSVMPTDAVGNAFARAGADNNIELRFELRKEHFFDLDVRVRALGLSYGNEIDIVPASGADRNATRDNYARLRAIVKCPFQVASDRGSADVRPTALFGTVGLFGGSGGVDLVDSNAIANISPFGEWQVVIAPFATWKDHSSQHVHKGVQDSAPIRDMKMHFTLVHYPS